MSKREIPVSSDFKRSLEKAVQDFEARLAERKKADVNVQRNATMTKEERGRRGVEFLTRKIKENADTQGRHISEDSARSQAAEIARKSDRRDSEGK